VTFSRSATDRLHQLYDLTLSLALFALSTSFSNARGIQSRYKDRELLLPKVQLLQEIFDHAL